VSGRLVQVLFGGLGGHGSVAFALVDGLDDWDHRLLFVSREPLLAEYSDRCRSRDLPFVWHRAGAGVELSRHWSMFRWLVGQRADVVVVHSPGALWSAVAARLLRPRSRLVVVEHQAWHLRDSRNRVATPVALLAADTVVVLNGAYRDALVGQYPRLSRVADVRVIPNGIDTDVFRSGGRQRGAAVIGMQSRLIPIKDHPTLIRAVAELRSAGRDVRLDVAGTGSVEDDLKALVTELCLDDHVRFRGFLDEAELVDFLDGLDLYVHATFGEAMSTAVLQAMAVGLPVVASAVPGIEDVEEFADAVVTVAPGDVSALADVIGALLDDPAERERLGHLSRSVATATFSRSGMVDAYRGVARGLPQGTGVAAPPVLELLEFVHGPDRPTPRMRFWPSGVSPRVAVPVRGRLGRVLHRVGVFGGGHTVRQRRLLRSRPAWPAVRFAMWRRSWSVR
jgi:glycosyltransferase involved in cell wall biosynthesis